uniref:Uncharacterized protein n=1 Tax=Marmota marmota marmota TaxID=9994 RepID=A0A8C6A8H9_MARMA
MAAMTYERLKLQIIPEKFYVEACDNEADDILTIDPVSTEVTLIAKKDVPPSAVTRPIFRMVGTHSNDITRSTFLMDLDRIP